MFLVVIKKVSLTIFTLRTRPTLLNRCRSKYVFWNTCKWRWNEKN